MRCIAKVRIWWNTSSDRIPYSGFYMIDTSDAQSVFGMLAEIEDQYKHNKSNLVKIEVSDLHYEGARERCCECGYES